MDRRLIQAYDNMTMPDDCSLRIEQKLQEASQKKRKKKRTETPDFYQPRRPSRAGTIATVLGSLALIICVGGTALHFLMEGRLGLKPSGWEMPQFSPGIAEPTEPKPAENEEKIPEELKQDIYDMESDPFPYGEKGLQFLETMCHVMPHWDGYASLDDVFWTEFVVRLMNEWEYSIQGDGLSSQVMTPAGTGMLIHQENKVYMTRAAIDEFVQKTMGCELPDFMPSGEFQNKISFGAEIFSVDVIELDRYRYELTGWEQGSFFRVSYAVYNGTEETPASWVTFQLKETENDQGFIILGRIQNMRMSEMKNPEVEEVALAFARGFFAGDIEVMKQHLSDREDSSLIFNPFVQGSYTGMEEGVDYKLFGVRIFRGEVGIQHMVAFVDYAYIPIRDYPSHSLMLDVVETETGWKVRNWNEGNPEDYDPDRGEIYDTTVTIVFYYLWGNAQGMQEYMTSELYTPPVYEGEVVFVDVEKYPQTQKIEIYFDPLGETNEAGELMADVYVEIKESADAMNPIALYLHFVKQDGQWKVDMIGEG